MKKRFKSRFQNEDVMHDTEESLHKDQPSSSEKHKTEDGAQGEKDPLVQDLDPLSDLVEYPKLRPRRSRLQLFRRKLSAPAHKDSSVLTAPPGCHSHRLHSSSRNHRSQIMPNISLEDTQGHTTQAEEIEWKEEETEAPIQQHTPLISEESCCGSAMTGEAHSSLSRRAERPTGSPSWWFTEPQTPSLFCLSAPISLQSPNASLDETVFRWDLPPPVQPLEQVLSPCIPTLEQTHQTPKTVVRKKARKVYSLAVDSHHHVTSEKGGEAPEMSLTKSADQVELDPSASTSTSSTTSSHLSRSPTRVHASGKKGKQAMLTDQLGYGQRSPTDLDSAAIPSPQSWSQGKPVVFGSSPSQSKNLGAGPTLPMYRQFSYFFDPSVSTCANSDMSEPDSVYFASKSSVTSTQAPSSHLQANYSGPGWTQGASSCLPRSHSCPHLSSLSPTPSAEIETFPRTKSLPAMPLQSSFEEFTPDITVDEPDETYRFLCSRPGLYQCTVTGLVFHMDGDGDVVYRVVPWNRRLLGQHHKKPAGPLFDISCAQKSVRQLHLPHCEIRTSAGPESLSVAHVNDDGIEFIVPHKTTETHVIINITSFSGFGNVKDEDSPPDPVRGLVLLFYRPPADPDPESLLNVLLLPGNVVLPDVVRIRKKLVGDERYIEMSPQCKLAPKQKYTLSTCPEDDSVLVQPKEAEFDNENYDNYFPSFQVELEQMLRHIKLSLRDSSSSSSVWERRVCLSSSAVKKSCRQNSSDFPPNEKLLHIRSSFIDGVSGPVLKSLLDRLLERKVMCDSEKEAVDAIQTKREQARLVIDTVRNKGEAASSELMEILCELDEFLCEHLGLI